MSAIAEQVQSIKSFIDTDKVRIIAVTKYVTTDKVIEAFNSGLRDFGENKAQDAEKKLNELPENIRLNSTWHFLGHLQANKVKKVVNKFDYIHSVDSLKIAQQIAKYAKQEQITQKILIQVNAAKEETKYGMDIEEVKEVFKELISLEGIEVVGLMNIAPLAENEESLRKQFRQIKELRDKLEKLYNCKLPELSMGMSNDYKLAIEEGSTMIRIGQLIFK
jgi:pyridoxal phosphate enzyme (YggS family)